ncbi:MAG: TIR domain-containing protein [Blautia sp.]|nr:TIR domain-containing protein [Blautia sp.]MCM1200992.1 TIR domain-containing protein [Bacteroides fragilis]
MLPENEKEKQEAKKYRYDAFISYRHMPLDKAVASRLQALLENSRLWKRREPLHIFRDQSELLTSSDLGHDIKEALLQSRYLITVCSEQTKESRWCMEEIRLFKEAHQGSTANILTLLVSGEPDKVFPDDLLFEERPVELPTGEKGFRKEKVEPLSADVRAQTMKKSLKKLKVESLRIAAPILGCRFDDLYQRRQRRRRRNAAIAAGSVVAVMAAVLIVVSIFAYRIWVSENKYRRILADNYAQEAGRYANSGKPQEALLYYTQSLSLEPEQSSAAVGAALLLQEYAWPVLMEESVGIISGKTFLPVQYARAGNPGTGYYLGSGREGFYVMDESGRKLAPLPRNYVNFLSESAGWWAFCDEENLFFYRPESGQEYTIPMPEESSVLYDADSLFLKEPPAAFALDGHRAVVACKGIVYIDSFDGGGRETARTDMALVYPDAAVQQSISSPHSIYLSQDRSLALVSSDSLAALYDMEELRLKASVQKYSDFMTGMDISADNAYFAVSYGAEFQSDLSDHGGYFEVYSEEGELLFASEHYRQEAFIGISFHPGNADYLIVWSPSSVHVWNWKEGRETAAPVRENNIQTACITEDGTLLVDNRDDGVSFYELQKPPAGNRSAAEAEAEGSYTELRRYYNDAEGPDGKTVSVTSSSLTLADADGRDMDKIPLPSRGERAALSNDFRTVYLYSTYEPSLMCVPVDFDAGKFGEVKQLDCSNEKIMRICFEEEWLAAELQSKDILLFDKEGNRAARITPAHNGGAAALLIDSDMRYVVLVMEETVFAGDSFHFSMNGIIEIWDIPSQLMLSSFQWENRKIDSAYITGDGTLCWNIRGTVGSVCLAAPSPDEEALRFLRNLPCLALDDKQDIVCQKPGNSALQAGTWSGLTAGWGTERMLPEPGSGDADVAESILKGMTAELTSAEDYGEESWFRRYDGLWQSLLNGEISFRMPELDNCYACYLQAAESRGLPERIESGLEAYLALQLSYSAPEGKEDDIAYTGTIIDSLLLQTLAYTQLYDTEIIRFLEEACSVIEEEEIVIPEDADDIARMRMEMEITDNRISLAMFGAWARILEGDVQEALLSLSEAYLAEPLFADMAAEPLALAYLTLGDTENAGELIDQWIAHLLLLDDDPSLMEESLCRHFLWGDILAMRGAVGDSVYEEYLRNIDTVIFGMQTVEVSVPAQEAGVRLNDIIVGMNGKRLSSLQRCFRIKNEEGIHTAEVLRDGETVTITMPDPPGITGEMIFRPNDFSS